MKSKKKNQSNFSKKSKDFVLNLKKLFTEKKGFLIAILFFSITLIFLVFYQFPNENYAQALEYYNYNKNYLNGIEDEILLENPEDDLDKAYHNSVLEDLNWLKEINENAIIEKNSFLSVASATFFIQEIITLNYDFSNDFINSNYETMIDLALKKEFKPFIVENEEIEENELKNINDYLSSLSKKYYNYKINIINSDNNIERKFVEAKKIYYFFE